MILVGNNAYAHGDCHSYNNSVSQKVDQCGFANDRFIFRTCDLKYRYESQKGLDTKSVTFPAFSPILMT